MRALVDGTPVSTVVVSWRGNAVLAASDFTETPRRIRYDGASTAALTFVPRDVNGIPLGPGHTVDLQLQGTPSAGLGSTTDAGDGSYGATLAAGTEEETLAVAATVDAMTVAGTYAAEVGFPLAAVVGESLDDLGAMVTADPPPPAKAYPKLAKAESLLAATAGFWGDDLSPEILAAVPKALKQLEAAAKKGSAATAVETDLAEAAREAARKALDAAGPLADTGPEQKALSQGETLFGQGEVLLDGALWSKAAAKFRSARLAAAKVK